MNTLRVGTPLLAITIGLATAGCAGESAQLKTVETTSFGVDGSNFNILDESLSGHRQSVEAGITKLYADGLCSVNLTVRDLNKHPDLEFIENRGQAAGRGFPGGELYIAGNIKPEEEQIDVVHLTTHEALHACVRKKRVMDQDITAPESDLAGRYISGFHLSVGLPVAEFPNTGSLDEAAVEWMSRQVIENSTSKDTGYGQTSALFGSIAKANGLTVEETAKLHENSDIVGLIEELTGIQGTADRVGCVILAFVKLQLGYVDLQSATQEVDDC